MFLGNVNRYCASGLETIGMATKIQSGMAHCIIAGGAESMSFIDGRLQTNSDYAVAKAGNELLLGNGFNSRSSSTTV
jgi:acetyl-CoA acyltransferase